MSNTRTPTEKIGIRYVKQVVEEFWNSRFQELNSTNDDGIDGIIFISKKGEVTGEMLFIQIKTGKTYKYESQNSPGILKIKLGTDHLKKHRPRWNTYPGPVVLIYVDNTTDKFSPKSWWCSLKDEAAYSTTAKSIVLVNEKNTFGEHSKGYFKTLCTHHKDYHHTLVETTTEDFSYFKLSKTIKHGAREKYQSLINSNVAARFNPLLGEIIVSRVGWRHICRKGRSTDRMQQSFLLIGAISPIITKVAQYNILGEKRSSSNQTDITVLDYIGLKAKVTFPFRFQSVVIIVLKRKRIISKTTGIPQSSKIWFYTIYESRRGEIAF